jgi:hypothetical protein
MRAEAAGLSFVRCRAAPFKRIGDIAREVSKALADQGFLNERGKPYAAKSVASMLRHMLTL